MDFLRALVYNLGMVTRFSHGADALGGSAEETRRAHEASADFLFNICFAAFFLMLSRALAVAEV